MDAQPSPDPVNFAVPIVDIGAYVGAGSEAARAEAAARMDAACRTVGFVQVRGHGIDAATIDAFTAAMDAFFSLPLAEKSRYRTPPEINRGYAPPLSESLSLSLGIAPDTALNDYFEAFNIGTPASAFPNLHLPADVYADNLWPAAAGGFDADAFRTAMQRWFAEAQRVARTLTRVFADALGVEHRLFAQATDHSIDVLRTIRYALPEGMAIGDAVPTGMGAHTDYGIVTVLWADRVPGLQVLGPDGVWHDVMPEEDALLVNLGDLTARWTHDRWRSTLHRVVPPIVDGRVCRRRSAAFFHDGNIDARIETLPSCRDAAGTGYPPITVGEHLAAKLAGSRAGEANLRAGSEAARVRAARGSNA